MRLFDMDSREDYLLDGKYKVATPYAPCVDVAEVIRCKDCKWWGGSVNTSHNNHLCKRALNQNIEYWIGGNDYCSYGERREKGENYDTVNNFVYYLDSI